MGRDRAQTPLVLGSASPRRAALLRQLCLPFQQITSPEPELAPAGRPPPDFVVESAAAKASAVQRLAAVPPDAIVIGADTVVVLDGRITGKPRDAADAAAMLCRLSGRVHEVHTGIVLRYGHGRQIQGAECTRVFVRRLSPADIDWYVASGEPLDKAGAYGIQGLGARFIERIDGCYYNVVGLPLARLSAMLEAAGYRFVNALSNDAGKQ